MLSPDEFREQARDALHHLYDYPYLEGHPLARRYWPEVRRAGPSRAHRLNRLLLESIEELCPPGEPAPDTSHARFYALLAYRYVEERPLPDILRELGYSRSQFFREQQKAITLLASRLQEKLPPQAPAYTEPDNLLESEAERVLGQRETVDVAEVVHGTLEVVKRLAHQEGVDLAGHLEAGLPPMYGSRTLLRQVLLEGLSQLISQPDTHRVRVHVWCEAARLVTELVGEPGMRRDQRDQREAELERALEPVRRLVAKMGGRSHGVSVTPEARTVRFDIPAESRKTVLVVEDDEGIVRVFQGYLASYGYRVMGAATRDEALGLARQVCPAAITLDIMMPSQDGWEILQALKSDLATQSIPVVICSVLEDPALAYSLGAAAYLRKPVSQAALLAALNELPDIA